MAKTRKLYAVRYYGHKGSIYSRTVGFKGRLLARDTAMRIAKRLRRCGVDATVAPVLVAG